tara:strand:+ start:1010 stop:1438 length:429 start_codon:yes stop_codon:yes gene_type:complete
MAAKSVKYWSKSNISNAIPYKGEFVNFEELVDTGIGYLATEEKELNEFLESNLGSYGLRSLSKGEYEESKKKTLSSGSKQKWREEFGGSHPAPDTVAQPAPLSSEQKAVTAANPKETVFSKTEKEGSLPENYKPKAGKRQSK